MQLRGNLKITRLIVQSVSFLFFVLLAAAGVCIASTGAFGVSCVFGSFQRILAQPFLSLATMLLVFMIVPIVGTILLGRLFCGWLCPIGTILDISSRIPRVKSLGFIANPINKFVLAAAFLTSSAFLKYPSFCSVCPIKGLCNSTGLNSALKPAELALMAIPLGLEFTQKRAWCRFFCPVGATLAFLSIRRFLGFSIDTNKCARSSNPRACGLCTRACPTDAIGETSFKTGKISGSECIACGRCYDACRSGALRFGKPQAERAVMTLRA